MRQERPFLSGLANDFGGPMRPSISWFAGVPDHAALHVAPARRLSHPAHVGARLWTSAGGFAVSVSINTRRISVTTRSTWTCSPILPKETSKNSTSLAATAGVCSGQ